ncbi:MAG: hypothetical protein IJ594_09145 [Oscillospiraceae bacterium]|nr:hypothetical protein [Oscillospiraceae bacterium]
MMKRVRRQILALALVFCLLAAYGAAAYADTKTTSVTATVGKEFNYSETISGEIKEMQKSGDCPGLVFGVVAQGFVIYGTPTTPGTYTLQTVVNMKDGSSDTYSVTITVNAAGEGGGSGGEQAVVVPATPSPSPAANGKVTITKHPTGETVESGGTAYFVARAENAETFNWGLYNPSTDDYYTSKQAQEHFSGLSVEVQGDASDTTLILSGIGYSLNGWYVEARFFGSDKTNRAFSNGARITVTGGTLPTPKITSGPSSVSLERGKTATLSVKASVDAGTLNYQWYKNDVDKNSGGTAITGATSSSYTPPETTGTTYYYVNVWGSDGTRESTHVNSAVAAVQYPAAPATPTPTSTPTTQTGTQSGIQYDVPTGTDAQSGTSTAQTGGTTQTGGASDPQNGNSAPGSTQAVVTTVEPEGVSTSSHARGHSTIIVLILILAAVLLAACIALFILKRSQQDEF